MNVKPTPNDLARNLEADLDLLALVVESDRGVLHEIASAGVRRAIEAERRVERLEALGRKLQSERDDANEAAIDFSARLMTADDRWGDADQALRELVEAVEETCPEMLDVVDGDVLTRVRRRELRRAVERARGVIGGC